MANRIARSFSAESDEFRKAIIWTAKGANNDYPNINFAIHDGMIRLHSYNGIHGTQAQFPINQKFDDDLKFSVPSHLILNVIQQFKDGEINFRHDGKLLITAPRIRVNLPTTNPREVAQLPDTPRILGKVDRASFSKMATEAARVSGDDPLLTQLTIMTLDFMPHESTIRFGATDGYRIIMRDISYDPSQTETETTRVVLDSRSLKDMVSAQKDEETIELSIDNESKNFSTTGNFTKGTLVISSSTPKNIAPFRDLPFQYHITCNRRELLDALRSSKPMISQSAGVINFAVEDQGIFIRTYEEGKPNAEVEPNTEFEVELLGTNLDEENQSVIISARLEYFQSLVDMADSDLVRLDLNSPYKPLRLTSMTDEETEDKDYLSIFMPLKL